MSLPKMPFIDLITKTNLCSSARHSTWPLWLFWNRSWTSCMWRISCTTVIIKKIFKNNIFISRSNKAAINIGENEDKGRYIIRAFQDYH